MQHDFQGPLAYLAARPDPIDLRIQTLYNPEGITRYNIVPGLMGVVLTMTMVMITGLGITRERERGTMENLLSMPAHPAEVLIGKIIPYILLGYIQVGLILAAAYGLFHVPMMGSLALLLAAAFVFIAANLAMGITFSTLAKNQLQAVQMAYFFFLPSIMLSGFMFPFRGMPRWAQDIGEILPLTHFLRIIARHPAQRQRPPGSLAAALAHRPVRRHRADHRRETLPPDAGLARPFGVPRLRGSNSPDSLWSPASASSGAGGAGRLSNPPEGGTPNQNIFQISLAVFTSVE